MYVTRPLSMYRNEGATSAAPVPAALVEGPNTGVLVIEDEAAESRWLFGLLKRKSVKAPPFPQNKIMELRYTINSGEHQHTDYFYALLIPVINRPLSSNKYYVIKSRGKTKGLACTSSKEDDETSCCCFGIPDTPPQLFDPTNAYQQFQISNYVQCAGPCGFMANSIAPDGVPPRFLRRRGWRAYTKTFKNKNLELTQALGLDAALRAHLPALNFSLPAKSSDPVVVGKWYCPFIFVRDGEVGSQVSNSPYYEMTLQQSWEEIFGCGNLGGGERGVDFDVSVEKEVILIAGQRTDGREVGDGVVWFGSWGVGLSLAIVERVKWEEERAGFEFGKEKEKKYVKVKRREEYGGVGEWKRFGCYVLIERFVLKRMDGSLVLTWEFKHTHQIRTKWE
ncbi:uncharacterized protein LOC111017584 [Momordica charantia]|uniref:Uncharacterized protein LOC111017584 n=1 Tax=Momordica charantia TaxID=3673 RepID=A0A6J1D7B1_MOMCH|nr:uncharacterized protein LOC111017584 [Momordica charantia]